MYEEREKKMSGHSLKQRLKKNGILKKNNPERTVETKNRYLICSETKITLIPEKKCSNENEDKS